MAVSIHRCSDRGPAFVMVGRSGPSCVRFRRSRCITATLCPLRPGNTTDNDAWAAYPHSLSTNSVYDPGAGLERIDGRRVLELTTITEEDAQHYAAVAAAGNLSPYTTTSVTWQNGWPFKPDIVMEGALTIVLKR